MRLKSERKKLLASAGLDNITAGVFRTQGYGWSCPGGFSGRTEAFEEGDENQKSGSDYGDGSARPTAQNAEPMAEPHSAFLA